MRKILTILIILLSIPLFSFSQDSTSLYSKYEFKSIGENSPQYVIGINDTDSDTLGIMFNIEQAQKIEYKLELFSLYKMMNNDFDSSIIYLKSVIDEYKRKDEISKEKFKTYERIILTRDKQIINLKSDVQLLEETVGTKNEIIENKDKIIGVNDKQIKKLRRQRNGLIAIGSTVIAGCVYWAIGHPGIN